MVSAIVQEQERVLQPCADALRLCERARRFEDEVEPWLRGVIATEVWRDQPELPVVLKKAEVLARALEEIPPIILPEDRILGIAYRRLRVHQGVGDPDAWRIRVKNPEFWPFNEQWPVPDEVRRTLRWWNENGRRPLWAQNQLRQQNHWLQKYGIAWPNGWVGGHTLPDHGILLQAGIHGLRERIAVRLASAAAVAQRKQLRAMDRCLEGLRNHCRVCAAVARAKAAEVSEPHLAVHLREAAANADALAESAPRTFAQALQLLFFSNCADIMDNHGDAASFGRIDQLLYPFYAAGLEDGTLTRAEAFDLVGRFIAKKWYCQTSNNMTVGGVDADGNDATNDLSFMFLEAMAATAMTTSLSVRLHRDAPKRFVRTVARVMRLGLGRPDIYNDEVTIEALVRKGVEVRAARDYAPLGCVEIMIPGRTSFRTMCMGLSLPKVLELTLNQGRCLVTGDVVWDDVPEHFDSFDALLREHRARVRHIVDVGVEIIREDERIEPDINPRPWLTVLSRDGIDDAVDLTAGQTQYDPVGVTLDGIADIANSLCAVKRLVYDDRRLSLAELRCMLQADWEGEEALRQFVIGRLPRYGQDVPEVDDLARAEAAHYAACFEPHRTLYGDRFWPMIFGVSTGMIQNKAPKTGATPSGRRRGEALAMSLQPSPAGPQGPMTALLRSCTAIDCRDYPGGVSNVQEFDPSQVTGEKGLDLLVQLISGFMDLGGMELSLNFLSEEMLRTAQEQPDHSQHLMVRLFGLSARFIALTPLLQESVIERVRAASRRPG